MVVSDMSPPIGQQNPRDWFNASSETLSFEISTPVERKANLINLVRRLLSSRPVYANPPALFRRILNWQTAVSDPNYYSRPPGRKAASQPRNSDWI